MFENIIEGYRWLFLQIAESAGVGWGIVVLSCITSSLMAPLMKAVSGIVRRESEYQLVILPQIAKINSLYSTDMERHLHIERLYSRYGYSPLSAVKKVLPLLVQIPFLLLTYYMLKGTEQIHGIHFLFLHDLGQPDELIKALSINVLPIVMTGVNILTVFATPGFTFRDWVQAIGISLLFLVMLYTAPSALLLYWTLNNIITFLRTTCTNKFAGGHLLLRRIVMLRDIPMNLKRVAMPTLFAWIVIILYIITIYFCITAKVMSEIIEGSITKNFTASIMYKGMTFVLAVAAIISLYWLRRDTSIRQWILWTCMGLCILFAIILLGMSFISREALSWFLERVDLYMCITLLSIIWTLPYLFCRNCHRNLRFNVFTSIIYKNGYLLLLPLALAIHYSFSSVVFVLPLQSVVLLCIYMVMPCILLFTFLTLLFNKWIMPQSLFRISIGLFFGIYLIPLISTEDGFWAYSHNISIRLFVIALVCIVLVLYKQHKPMVLFCGVFLTTIIISSLIRHGKDITISNPVNTGWRDRLKTVVGDAHCLRTNNVYLFVYDSYGHKSILDGLHMHDGGIYSQLVNHGFTLYNSYSVGANTLTSMEALFTIGGYHGGSQKSTIAGDNIFADFLLDAGYKSSYLLCGYIMPKRGERMPGTFYFPDIEDITRPEMVLFPCLLRGTLSQSPTVFDKYSFEEWIEVKKHVLQNVEREKCFVYAHEELPQHAPWDPRSRKTDFEEQQSYRERLKLANIRIEEDIKFIEKDPNALVIMMSDHGGSLLCPDMPGNYDMKNIVDHFGVFLAIRWPKDYKAKLSLCCLQNVLLEVMIYMSGDDSLSRYASNGETMALPYPIGAPKGYIKNGVIQIGRFAGRSFSEAATEAFEH